MSDSLLIYLAIALYTLSTVLIGMHLRSANLDETQNKSSKVSAALVIAFAGVVAHGAYAWNISFIDHALNFGLSSMLVLVSGLLTLIYLAGGLLMPIRRLGVLVFPLTILSLVFALFWDDSISISTNTSLAFNAHIIISLLAYSLLTIASVQGLLYVYQERQIKRRTKPTMLLALPPLQTMEQLLFRLVGLGFALLTLTLVSGAIFSSEIFGYAFTFRHHTILAMLGWLVFATLLFKRVKHGLRGSQAVIWTIAGFLLIQLGYFGTKIVSETLAVQ